MLLFTDKYNPSIDPRSVSLFQKFATIGTFVLLLWTTNRGGTGVWSVEASAADQRNLYKADDIDTSVDHMKTNGQNRHLQSFDSRELEKNFELATAQFMTKLKANYGNEAFETLFFDTNEHGEKVSVTRSQIKAIGESSWHKMTRKVAMKILKAQIEQKTQPFVWATGGHSSSAGHGNFFNESYTSILSVAGPPIFAAVGLDFTARSRAMGTTPCGMEIAICAKEVFGRDIDVLSWDYGLTTRGDSGATELYFHRAAILPERPYFVAINAGRVANVLPTIESLGPAMFHVDNKITSRVPDSKGKTPEEIDQMPPYIRCFRFGRAVESNECHGSTKFTSMPGDVCNKRKGQTSWHPGWKWHALFGNLLTLFWTEIIGDALKEINQNGSDPEALMKTFKQMQEQEYIPLTSKNVSNIKSPQHLKDMTDIPYDLVYWEPNICHTARLPAETRYLGILTGSESKGGYENYDKGYLLSDVQGKINDEMPLTYYPGLREGFCKNHTIRIDFPDIFLVNQKGWSSLVLPNPTEQSYYSTDYKALQGFISICLAFCDWGCPQGVLHPQHLGDSELFSMKVNDKKVESFSKFGIDRKRQCLFLKHSSGHQWTANNDGQYEISAKTMKPSNFVSISSIVIW